MVGIISRVSIGENDLFCSRVFFQADAEPRRRPCHCPTYICSSTVGASAPRSNRYSFYRFSIQPPLRQPGGMLFPYLLRNHLLVDAEKSSLSVIS